MSYLVQLFKYLQKGIHGASGDNGMLIQSLGITEWVQVLGLSALLNGAIIASIDYFYKKRAVRNELQLQAMKDKANACSEFCFYLTRMIHNYQFQLASEDIRLIEQTFKDIDEKIKDNFYILDEDIRLSWISLRSNWDTEYKQNHVNFVRKAIDLNNNAARILNISRKKLEKKIVTKIDEVKLINYEELKYYSILESVELLKKFLEDAKKNFRDKDDEKLFNLYEDLKKSLLQIMPKAPVYLSDRFKNYDKEMEQELESLDELELREDPDVDMLTEQFITDIRNISGYY